MMEIAGRTLPHDVRSIIMKISEELKKLTNPGEKAIVFDPDNGDVHHCDFTPIQESKGGSLSLYDIVDGTNDKDVLQVVSMAMQLPGTMTESECTFRGENCRVRVVYFAPPDPSVFLFMSHRDAITGIQAGAEPR